MYRVGRLRLYLTLVIILLLESNLFYQLTGSDIRPNLMLIFIVFVGLYSDWREALEAGIVGGLLRGALTSGSVGINLTILGLCGLFVHYCKNKVYRESIFTQVFLTMLLAAIFNAMVFFSGTMARNIDLMSTDIHYSFMSTAIRASLYTALMAPPVFFILKRSLRTRESRF